MFDRPPSINAFSLNYLAIAALKKDIDEYSNSYQHERVSRLGASWSKIDSALKRLGVTYKKTFVHPKADEEKRLLFKNKIDAYKAAGIDIVCDWFKTHDRLG